jgi:hypothetical protein
LPPGLAAGAGRRQAWSSEVTAAMAYPEREMLVDGARQLVDAA